MTAVASVNGRITPTSEARISVLDRAFLYGDGVYETLRTYAGRPFLLERHLERLAYSAGRLEIPLPRELPALAAEVQGTLQAAANPESLIRVVVTRGEGMLEGDPRRCGPPNLVILVQPLVPIPEEVYRTGISAVVVQVRRNPIASLDPRIKSNNLLNALLASMEAHRRSAREGILLNTEGDVAESTHANVFVVLDGTLVTPSLESGVLAGITREVVLGLARDAEIPCRTDRIPGDRLARAREIFLTSTTREVLPVVRLDGRGVGDARPGPITRRIHRLYRDRTKRG